jgi:YfiH family protein
MKFLKTDLEDISWVDHGFFTRQGGVSSGLYTSLNCGLKSEDKQTNVQANRSRVAGALGIAPDHLMMVRQVHGIKAICVTKPWTPDHAPEADAMVTAEPGIGLGILTADCAPVLLASKKERVIGAAHAGWRSALGGILDATVHEMEKLGAKRGHIEAAIGPCIGPRSYEVKEDFRAGFLQQDKKNEQFFKPSPKPGHFLFNLAGYLVVRLDLLGVKMVYNMGLDTLTNEIAYFSNRRAFLKSEKSFGLQASVIAIKSSN